MAYYAIEPFGYKAEWQRFAMLAAVIANVFRSKKTRAFKPEDFMPGEPRISAAGPQSMESMKKAMQAIFDWAQKRRLTKQNGKQLKRKK